MHSTHDQCREAWKTVESFGVTESGYLKYRYGRLSLVRVWVTVGTGPQCCNGKTFGMPIKGYILYCKGLDISGFVQLLVVCRLLDSCKSQALVMLLAVAILL